MVKILGIETSCDETGIAVVEDGRKILSDKLKSSVDLQSEYGGVVPELASRVHVENINLLIKQALQEAHLEMSEIDAVAVANGPGLTGALLVGTMVAKTIGLVLQKKIVSVNHLEGHIYASFLKSQTEIEFPILVLIVSGGHTELVLMTDFGVYQEIGTTIDDAAGEAFDKAAKILGLAYPGGPSVAKEASKFAYELKIDNEKNINKLPRPMIDSGDYRFSFSGLKTALLYEVQKFKSQISNSKFQISNQDSQNLQNLQNNHKSQIVNSQFPVNFQGSISKLKKNQISINSESDGLSLEDEIVAMLAYEFQEAVVEVLVTKTKRAMKNLGVTRLAVVGGVAANQRLREKIYAEIDGEIMIPEFKYCTDNGVKIAVAGYYKYMKGEFVRWEDLEVCSNWEL